MMKYKVAIVDDNVAAVDALRMAFERKAFIEVVGHATLYEQAKRLVFSTQPDLLFLDVELPCYTGFQLLEEIRPQITWPMQVVFYTAYDKYVMDALRVSAFDVLLKPFSFEELDQVLDRFLKSKKFTEIPPLPTTEQLVQNSSFLVSTVYGFKVMYASQIGAFYYNRYKRQWSVVHVDNCELFLKRSTTANEILAYSSCFVQVNQQAIINVNYLALIKHMRCVMIPPFDHLNDLKISRKYFSMLEEVFQFI